MKTISSNEKIKINFTYNKEMITISGEPFATIGEMKQKAIQKFYQCPLNVHCFHVQKDISEHEDEEIAIFFKHKNIKNIELVPVEDDENTEETQNKTNKNNIENCICGSKKICYYCRICQEFLCQNCRMNKKHKNHLMVHVEQNREESAKLYAVVVQNDIEDDVQNCEQLQKKLSLMLYEEESAQQKAMINKLTKVNQRYQEVFNTIKAKVSEELLQKEKIDGFAAEYQEKSNLINEDINKILQEIDSNKDAENKKIYSYFDKINKKEKEWEKLTKKYTHFKVFFELNNQMKKMYEKINKVVDELMTDSETFRIRPKPVVEKPPEPEETPKPEEGHNEGDVDKGIEGDDEGDKKENKDEVKHPNETENDENDAEKRAKKLAELKEKLDNNQKQKKEKEENEIRDLKEKKEQRNENNTEKEEPKKEEAKEKKEGDKVEINNEEKK